MPVRGDLGDMDLCSIISINCNQMNQARLIVRNEGREARIFFCDGNIVHMSLGPREGEEVIHELLSWEGGTFELERGIPAPRRTVATGWSQLLLDGMRHLNEGRALELRSLAGLPWPMHERDDDRIVAEAGTKVEDVERPGEDPAPRAEVHDTVEATTDESALIDVAGAISGADAATTDLKVLAEALFQMGLDCGLSADESALQASQSKLPASITEKGAGEFKEWLIEAYQQRLDDQVRKLREQLELKGNPMNQSKM